MHHFEIIIAGTAWLLRLSSPRRADSHAACELLGRPYRPVGGGAWYAVQCADRADAFAAIEALEALGFKPRGDHRADGALA